MKRQLLVFIALAAFATASTTNAFGQTAKTGQAHVKFDFQIGERIYPAGEYRIESINRQSGSILQIRSVGGSNKTQIILANQSIRGAGQTPRLVFQKYGANYSLTKINLDGGQWGYSIRPSRRQSAREKNLALASLLTIEVRLAQ
jgi:hypothetical protein